MALFDRFIYDVELSVREMRVVYGALNTLEIELDTYELQDLMTEEDMKTLRRLRKEFKLYDKKHFSIGDFPEKIGKKVKKNRFIDKP